MRRMLPCVLLLALACGTAKLTPVEIAAEDMCENCRMAISEQRFAAEFIDGEGVAHKFDDLGCMKAYLKAKSPRMAACFVMDSETLRWVTGQQAFYMRSAELKTPMGGGMLAFATRARAEDAARRYQGAVLSYREVFE